jgi:hypothetical protein
MALECEFRLCRTVQFEPCSAIVNQGRMGWSDGVMFVQAAPG